MTRMYLVRHATTAETGRRLSGRRAGVGLSRDGLAEAEAVARALAPLAPARICSSPLERAQSTAGAVAACCGAAIEVIDGLNEIDFGEWTGRDFDALDADDGWRTFNTQPSRARIPGGSESLEAVGRRGAEAIAALAAGDGRGPIVAVTHGDVIRLVLARLLGMAVDDFRRLTIDPASVSCVSCGDGPPLVSLVNHPASGLTRKEPR